MSQIPSSLSAKDCERGNVAALGGDPPIRFVPDLSEEKADPSGKAETCTIKLVGDSKDTYEKYNGGKPEEAIIHLRLFEEVMSKKGCYSHWKTARAKVKEVKDKKKRLAEGASSAELDLELNEALEARKNAMKEAWQLFERLLNSRLVPPWQQIAKKAVHSAPHVDKQGQRQDGKRGNTWEALDAAKREWLLGTPMEPNAAERHKRYMQVQIRMPSKGLKVRAFIERIREMNEYFQYLPTQKEVEGAPKELKNGKEPFTQIELCEVVLMAIPFNLSSAYWGKQKAGHYPMDLDALTEELVKLEPEFNRLQSLLDAKKREDAKGKAKKSDEKPTVAKKSQQHKHKQPGGGKQKMLCQRCALWSPQVKHTHNTDKCLKWEKDGTAKSDRIPRKNAHALKRSDSYEELKKSFVTMSKCMESLTRKQGRRKRTRRNRRERSDSEYSSEDDF